MSEERDIKSEKRTQLWRDLVSDKYPKSSVEEIDALRLKAAMHWATGDEGELFTLYEQYMVVRELKSL